MSVSIDIGAKQTTAIDIGAEQTDTSGPAAPDTICWSQQSKDPYVSKREVIGYQ